MMVIFEFPTLKLVLNICENAVYFFYYVGDQKNDEGFSQNNKILKKLKFLKTTTYCYFKF